MWPWVPFREVCVCVCVRACACICTHARTHTLGKYRRGVTSWITLAISNICTWNLSVVQSLSHDWLFVTLRIVACQTSLSFTISRSLLKIMSIESVMPSNHLILCHPPSPSALPLLLLPSIFPSIRVFSNELALRIRETFYPSSKLPHSSGDDAPGDCQSWMWVSLLHTVLHAGEPGTQEGMWQGDGAIISFHSVRVPSAPTPPQGHKEGQANPIWKALFAEGKKKIISVEKLTHWFTLVLAGSWQERKFLQMDSGHCGPRNGPQLSVIDSLHVPAWHPPEQKLCRNRLFTCEYLGPLRTVRGQRGSKQWVERNGNKLKHTRNESTSWEVNVESLF